MVHPMQYIKFDLDSYRQAMRAFVDDSPASQVFWDALDFAYAAHALQWRRSGDPYIVHPCSVARILAEELDIRNPEILASALLHDTVEDVPEVTNEVIREKFGPNVEAIVEGCTKVTQSSLDRQALKKLVHRKIFSGTAAKLEVMIVKLADRLHNLRTLSSMPRHRRQKIADETLDIYAPLSTILGLFDIKREMYTHALIYRYPRQGRQVLAHIKKLADSPEAAAIVDQVQQAMNREPVLASVTLRTKGLWGYYDIRNRILLKEIETPQEFLILTGTRSDCYRALGVINAIYPPIPRTLRDFIASPKPSGYQGLHARANIDGRKYLFKIRTGEMAVRAQRGIMRDWTGLSKSSSSFFKEVQEMFDILGSDDSISYRDIIAAGGRKEIYTYTPQGDLVCLPINSILLDFAFRVHSAIGRTCIGGMIGKRRVPIDQQLKDGNVIKVIRQEEPVTFDPALQLLCQTPKARSELARTFRQRRETLSQQIGASILAQELRRYGIPREILAKEEMRLLFTYFNLESREALYLQLGEGRLRLRELIYEISNGLYAGCPPPLSRPTGVFNRVDLTTLDPVAIKFSACCKPGPLDKGIIGLLSERGLSLHRKDCSQLRKINFQREEAVEVRWKLKSTHIDRTQKMIVMGASQDQLFHLLATVPEEMTVNDLVHLGKDRNDLQKGDWEISFRSGTLYGLKKIHRHFSRSSQRIEFDLDL